ncbi:hypothetical protein [Agromyces sp. NPDC058104]|uniref:hypothetical protein n=1 Tax=Agromyces sp. NPDC058104 TaxID=3346342 RepID=UPI0036DCBD4B
MTNPAAPTVEQRLAAVQRVRESEGEQMLVLGDLVDSGLLYHVNRYALHPFGYALAVTQQSGLGLARFAPGFLLVGDGVSRLEFHPDIVDEMDPISQMVTEARSKSMAEVMALHPLPGGTDG